MPDPRWPRRTPLASLTGTRTVPHEEPLTALRNPESLEGNL